jgi:NADH pyrophosphatase NudC (nudix superfamily)
MGDLIQLIHGQRLHKKIKAIIQNESGEFLLIQPRKYDSNHWTFVGGGISKGESSTKALHREIFKSFGITALKKITKLQTVHKFIFPSSLKLKQKLKYDGQLAEIFHVIVSDQKLKIQTEEITSVRWVNRDQVKTLLSTEAQKHLFDELLIELEQYKQSA